jgi:hypothetical protein
MALSSALPEMLLHLAQDVAARETEIGEGAVIERAQVPALASPAVPFDKCPETPSQEPSGKAAGQTPRMQPGRGKL